VVSHWGVCRPEVCLELLRASGTGRRRLLS
jgi:hypothetical protein